MISNLEAVSVTLYIYKGVKVRFWEAVIQTTSVKVLTCYSVHSQVAEGWHTLLCVETAITRQRRVRTDFVERRHHSSNRIEHELVGGKLGLELKGTHHRKHGSFKRETIAQMRSWEEVM